MKSQSTPLSNETENTEEFTREFRGVFEKLLVDRKIGSVFDLGCGDWQWQRHVKWPEGLRYEGWDISTKALTSIFDARLAPKPNFSLRQGDAFKAPLWPEADLLLVKDVVRHISPYQVRMLTERARLYSYVLWVLNIIDPPDGSGGFLINWHGQPDDWSMFDEIYRFRAGPKAAFLQQNP